MNQYRTLNAAILLCAGLVGCSAPMSQEEIERRTAERDARCQKLKHDIDAIKGKPLQRDYLLRQFDRDCRGP